MRKSSDGQAPLATGIELLSNTLDARRTNSTQATDKGYVPRLAVSTATASQSRPSSSSHEHIRSKYRHATALHNRASPSCLSHDSPSSPSFLGFRNLMAIVLIVSNLRLMIENLQKYGVLICVRCHDIRHADIMLGVALYILIPICLFIAYTIELFAARSALAARAQSAAAAATVATVATASTHTVVATAPTSPSERFKLTWMTIACAHFLNISGGLALTTYIVYYHIHHPLIGTLNELHALIVWLKTISYAYTNRDLRAAYLHPVVAPVFSGRDTADEKAAAIENFERNSIPELYATLPYPANISMRNLCYFWWAPTLVYQPTYPRTAHIRWVFFAKRAGEVFGLCVVMWLLTAQYALPTLVNSVATMHEVNLAGMVERLLKLSTISLVIWLCGFFALFQSFLNALAELMRFADRSFYDDWWNAPSLGAYWRSWNKPVYGFFKRHVYSPLRARGWGHQSSSVIVFLASALLHELLVGVPTHSIIGVAFIGMVAQLALISATERFERPSASATERLIGNSVFWLSFTVIGQPIAILIYFYTWHQKYGSVKIAREQSILESAATAACAALGVPK